MPKPKKLPANPAPDLALSDQEQDALNTMQVFEKIMASGKPQQAIATLVVGSKKDPVWLIDFILTLASAQAKQAKAMVPEKSSLILPGHLRN